MNRLRHAFTLLELMVAMAISLMVVLMLIATFRAVIGSIRATERLALHNALLRNGIITTLEEVDFWRMHDDPDDVSQQLNRAYAQPAPRTQFETGDTRGLTFTPFAEVANMADGAANDIPLFNPTGIDPAPAQTLVSNRTAAVSAVNATGNVSGSDAPSYPPLLNAPGSVVFPAPHVAPARSMPAPSPVAQEEYDRGWDPVYSWPAADERTWFHGDAGETLNGSGSGSTPAVIPVQRSDHRAGRYALFEAVRTVPNLGDPNSIAENTTGTGTGNFGVVESRHSWRANQIFALRHALGYYGWADYLPSNIIGATYLGVINNGGIYTDIDEAYHVGWSRFPQMPNSGISGSGYPSAPTHLFSATRLVTVTCFARSPYGYTGVRGGSTDSLTPASMAGGGSGSFNSDWNRGVTTGTGMTTDYYFGDWLYRAQLMRPLLMQRPESWPDLHLSMARYMTSMHFVNGCALRWSDATTSKVTEVSFNGFGTTLRGARQQRRYDSARGLTSGWVRWWAPDADMARIAAGQWYDRRVNADGTLSITLTSSPGTPPLARPAGLPIRNDRSLDHQP